MDMLTWLFNSISDDFSHKKARELSLDNDPELQLICSGFEREAMRGEVFISSSIRLLNGFWIK